MKKLRYAIASWLFAPCLALADVSVTTLLSTDYVMYGLSMSNGGPSTHVNIEADLAPGVVAGVWGSTVEVPPYGSQGPTSEWYTYAAWNKALNGDWSAGVELGRFNYFGSQYDDRTDFNAYTGSLQYRNYGLQIIHSEDLSALEVSATLYRLSGQWVLGEQTALRASTGFYDLEKYSQLLDLPDDSYHYLQLGVDYAWTDKVMVSLDGYLNSDGAKNSFGNIGRSRVAASVAYVF